jgi:hypothetical protein
MMNARALLAVLMVSAIAVEGLTAAADVNDGLCPRPKELSIDPGGAPADLTRGARIICLSDANACVANAAGRLRSELDRLPESAGEPEVTITLGILADWRSAGKKHAFKRQAEAVAEGPAEAYALHVAGGDVGVCGYDPRGALHGVETLIQLIRSGPKLPALTIHDHPDTPLRVGRTEYSGSARMTLRRRSAMTWALRCPCGMAALTRHGETPSAAGSRMTSGRPSSPIRTAGAGNACASRARRRGPGGSGRRSPACPTPCTVSKPM